MHIVSALLGAFKIWMLIDVAQRYPRCCGNYWFYLVLFPGGDFVYFFVVKRHDPEIRRILGLVFSRPTRLEDLQIRMEHCPSEQNRLLYAQGLFDAGRVGDARDIFRSIVERDDKQKEALLGLGLCELQTGELDSGLAHIRKLAEMDLSFRNFRGPIDGAKALREVDRYEEAIAMLVPVAKKSPHLEHTLDLAQLMIENGDTTGGSELVTKWLREERLNKHLLKPPGRAARRRAKQLLKAAEIVAARA